MRKNDSAILEVADAILEYGAVIDEEIKAYDEGGDAFRSVAVFPSQNRAVVFNQHGDPVEKIEGIGNLVEKIESMGYTLDKEAVERITRPKAPIVTVVARKKAPVPGGALVPPPHIVLPGIDPRRKLAPYIQRLITYLSNKFKGKFGDWKPKYSYHTKPFADVLKGDAIDGVFFKDPDPAKDSYNYDEVKWAVNAVMMVSMEINPISDAMIVTVARRLGTIPSGINDGTWYNPDVLRSDADDNAIRAWMNAYKVGYRHSLYGNGYVASDEILKVVLESIATNGSVEIYNQLGKPTFEVPLNGMEFEFTRKDIESGVASDTGVSGSNRTTTTFLLYVVDYKYGVAVLDLVKIVRALGVSANVISSTPGDDIHFRLKAQLIEKNRVYHAPWDPANTGSDKSLEQLVADYFQNGDDFRNIKAYLTISVINVMFAASSGTGVA